MTVLAIDPSGNFKEGKGTTGWALITEDKQIISCGQVLASNYNNKFDYWNSVINLIVHLQADRVVIEDFILYESKAKVQINSRFETSKLIGLLEMYCYTKNIPYYLQRAVDVKRRWSDDILINKGYVQFKNNRYYAAGVITSDHMRDAIRHGIHYLTFNLNKEIKNEL